MRDRLLMRCGVNGLTNVQVGVESQSAVLYVKGEGVDVKVTGADNPERLSIVHKPIVVQVHIRDRGRCVFIHAARQEQTEEL